MKERGGRERERERDREGERQRDRAHTDLVASDLVEGAWPPVPPHVVVVHVAPHAVRPRLVAPPRARIGQLDQREG